VQGIVKVSYCTYGRSVPDVRFRHPHPRSSRAMQRTRICAALALESNLPPTVSALTRGADFAGDQATEQLQRPESNAGFAS
jgi:hypothetical protein